MTYAPLLHMALMLVYDEMKKEIWSIMAGRLAMSWSEQYITIKAILCSRVMPCCQRLTAFLEGDS